MLDDVLAVLRCPHCGDSLTRQGGAVRCPRRHSFDVARQGYVSLLPPGARGGGGDTEAMVRARVDFLGRGHYALLLDVLVRTALEAVDESDGCVVDIGAGTGHYLAGVLDRLPRHVGLALDASTPALRRAARAHRRIGAAACDVWQAMPVADAVASLVLTVFAPRNAAELRRVVQPDGRLIVVTPTARHLEELVSELDLLAVDADKQERLAATLASDFVRVDQTPVETTMALSRQDAVAVVGMGPSAWHLDPAEIASKVGALSEPVPATLSVSVATYRPA